MIYVISDIHGCYEEYIELLEKIRFTDKDELYVLGDVVDRGPEPMKVLQDMMMRPNVYPILGNHDFIALMLLKKLNVEITEDNCDTHLTEADIADCTRWMKDGGASTMDAFSKLSPEEREDILDYLEEFSLYADVTVAGKRYVMVHGTINGFEEDKDLDTYDFSDFIFERADYEKRYFSDENTYLVTGHTPTILIHGETKIYEKHGHIALDCGCIFGMKLAAYCLNTGEAVYVEQKKELSS